MVRRSLGGPGLITSSNLVGCSTGSMGFAIENPGVIAHLTIHIRDAGIAHQTTGRDEFPQNILWNCVACANDKLIDRLLNKVGADESAPTRSWELVKAGLKSRSPLAFHINCNPARAATVMLIASVLIRICPGCSAKRSTSPGYELVQQLQALRLNAVP